LASCICTLAGTPRISAAVRGVAASLMNSVASASQ
jgi:hypothetical protein